MSIGELKAGLRNMADELQEALEQLREAEFLLMSGQCIMLRTTQGSGRAEVDDINGSVASAIADTSTAVECVGGTVDRLDDYEQRL